MTRMALLFVARVLRCEMQTLAMPCSSAESGRDHMVGMVLPKKASSERITGVALDEFS
jgi:hypothetical protein